jgi:peroxiredoxin
VGEVALGEQFPRELTLSQRSSPSDMYLAANDLPVPEDDGAADHLCGTPMPGIALASTSGATVSLDQLGRGRTVIYIYPLTGRPHVDLPDGWDSIPGARGCTAEACDFRDHHHELIETGVSQVFGLSSQDVGYQRELVERLRLPFAMLSDAELRLARALTLPTFTANDLTLYRRLTLGSTVLRLPCRAEARLDHRGYSLGRSHL